MGEAPACRVQRLPKEAMIYSGGAGPSVAQGQQWLASRKAGLSPYSKTRSWMKTGFRHGAKADAWQSS